MNKFIFILFIVPTVSFFGCNGSSFDTGGEDEIDIHKQDSLDLQRTLGDMQDEFLEFRINPLRDTLIVGLTGIKIHFEKDILQFEDGTVPTGSITLKLLELKDQSDFARNNIQTISDGKLLESGGAYFIEFVSDNRKLILQPGDSLKVQFPKQTDKEMFLFYGIKDSLNEINWIRESVELEPEIFYEIICVDAPYSHHEVYQTVGTIKYDEYGREMNYEICDTVYKRDAGLDSLVYQVTNLSKLGWINCDRFIESSKITDLTVRFKDEEIRVSNVYLIYKNYNSIVVKCAGFTTQIYRNNVFQNVPFDEEIKLVAIARSKGKLLSFQTDTLLYEDMIISIDFEETSLESLKDIFSW